MVLTVLGGIIVAAAACFAGYRSLLRSENRGTLVFKWVFSVVLVAGGIFVLRRLPVLAWPVAVLIPSVILGLMWAPSFGAIVARPLMGIFDGGSQEVEPQPFYSIAETKRRKGLYQEAAEEVRGQLEKFPADLTGTLLLGAILAEDLKDLPSTRQLIREWLDRPHVTPQGATAVLQALADWELQTGLDPEAARGCLERIVRDYPGTQFSHMAEQRIAHLPTPEYLLEARDNTAVDLRRGEKDIGLRPDFAGNAPDPDSDNPESLAESYVEQLRRHPADTDAREKLALLYAEYFKRLDLAAEQLEQLMSMPSETPKHVARWLNLLATLHVKVGGDLAAAERTLRRIIDRFPDSASATQAFERLASLNSEMRATQKPTLKTLGHYEKNLGLRQQPKI